MQSAASRRYIATAAGIHSYGVKNVHTYTLQLPSIYIDEFCNVINHQSITQYFSVTFSVSVIANEQHNGFASSDLQLKMSASEE